ncbi:hypothetical protein Micbo1qcDRAFT_206175 [Microdochium bolleyi]|uniref:Fucose-specific lectin n=1 Tax=Microdochium bolleyi TaxID=196109 RepID=A0A136IY57_9PEZI|nr:hypothetical protein Micbo1qcDRAFT_206175 [Microdochium bolleyi]
MLWSDPQPLFSAQDTGSSVRPALCDFNGSLFVAWPSMPDLGKEFAPSFSFTSRNASDDGWNPLKTVKFTDSAGKHDPTKHQDYVSALVVFQNSLYALVPVTSATSTGLEVFLYDGATFNKCATWSGDWHTDVAATTANGVLYVIGHRLSDSKIIWTHTNSSLAGPTNPPTLLTGQYSTQNLGLTARNGAVVALFLGIIGMGVIEMILDMTVTPPVWNVTDETAQVGRSGVSAMTTPDDAYSWISFKSTQADCIDICNYRFNDMCYDSADSLGDDNPAACHNEAALCWSAGKVYAVWNADTGKGPLHFRTSVPGQ